jgi:hypothetical protein
MCYFEFFDDLRTYSSMLLCDRYSRLKETGISFLRPPKLSCKDYALFEYFDSFLVATDLLRPLLSVNFEASYSSTSSQ